MNELYAVGVTYEVTIPGLDRRLTGCKTRCLIEPGYSTEADIPKMIAARLWGKPEASNMIYVTEVRPDDE